MSLEPANSDGEENQGAPEWMVTFSDCMTLLLTFFVLLISFSSFDDKTFKRMESAIAGKLPSINLRLDQRLEALRPKPEVMPQPPPVTGSESPTPDGRYESNPSESLDFLDFQRQKVILLPSEKVFWGQGTRISPNGRRVFADIAALIEALPNRVVVSEYGLHSDQDEAELGLRRAWQIVELLSGQGWRINNIDATIIAERPLLSPFIDQMRQNISQALSISKSQVSVKASTTEGLGFTGREEGIAAYSAALIEEA